MTSLHGWEFLMHALNLLVWIVSQDEDIHRYSLNSKFSVADENDIVVSSKTPVTFISCSLLDNNRDFLDSGSSKISEADVDEEVISRACGTSLPEDILDNSSDRFEESLKFEISTSCSYPLLDSQLSSSLLTNFNVDPLNITTNALNKKIIQTIMIEFVAAIKQIISILQFSIRICQGLLGPMLWHLIIWILVSLEIKVWFWTWGWIKCKILHGSSWFKQWVNLTHQRSTLKPRPWILLYPIQCSLCQRYAFTSAK